jgi:type III restriction enzyme
VIRVADTVTRIAATQAQAQAMSVPITFTPEPPFFIPEMSRTVHPGKFSLSTIEDGDFRQIGASLAATPDEVLRRSKIEVTTTAGGRLEVRPVAATDKIIAATPQLDLGQGKDALVQAILDLGLVTATASEKAAAERLAEALIEGLSSEAEQRLSSFFNTVIDTVKGVLGRRYKSVPQGESIAVTERRLVINRVNSRPVTSNHFEEFSREHAYDNWTKSLVQIEWFDSSTERAMAVLLDEDAGIRRWVRLHGSDKVSIAYEGRTYEPDFAVEDAESVYWLVETKDDRHLDSAEVLAKKKAAEKLARFASDSDKVSHKWRYLLVGETQLANAHGNWSVLLAQAGAK